MVAVSASLAEAVDGVVEGAADGVAMAAAASVVSQDADANDQKGLGGLKC